MLGQMQHRILGAVLEAGTEAANGSGKGGHRGRYCCLIRK